jgi:adenylate cyclase
MPRSSSAEMSANTAVDAVPGTAVREQLARIVDSPKFISSARLCRFLTHIVNRTGSYVPIFRWLDPQPQSPRQEIGTAFQAAASVTVLPFVNMSPEPEQGYFCDGISEEIINSLTRIAGLKVIARSSAFQFKGISVDIREVGRRLDADVIIEGSVRKAGEKLRITAQAIEAESGHDLW